MIKYLVVSQQPDGSDLTHSKHIGEHDALKSLYQIKRFRKEARIEYPDYESRKHDYLSLSKFGLELIMGLFIRVFSEGSSTFENEKALDELAGIIMELAEIHHEALNKAEHEVNALIR